MPCEKKTYQSGFTVARLEALEGAIAEGVMTVRYSDKEVTYRSMSEMLQARDLIRRALGIKKTCGGRGLFGGVRITAKHSKGLDGCE